MKTVIRMMFLMLAVAALAACQVGSAPVETAAPNAVPATESVLPANPAAAYPDPSYPAVSPEAEADADASAAGMYPAIMDGDIIRWEQVVSLIQNQEVAKIVQSHDLSLLVTLVDGRTLTATQTQIDAVLEVIRTCGDPCKDIAVATE